MKVDLNEREALLIVSALGVFQNRVGQHGSWLQRKRLVTLRQRLADCITIDDEEEAKGVRKAMQKAKKQIAYRTNLGEEASTLRERIKADAGIGEERIRLEDDEEE